MNSDKLAKRLQQQLVKVRKKKVARIREKISSGAYRVKPEKVARALVA